MATEQPKHRQLNIDQQATKEQNGKARLWRFMARIFAVFAVCATREAQALDRFLGETFKGVVIGNGENTY